MRIEPLAPDRRDDAAALAATAWDVPPPGGLLARELASPCSVAVVALGPRDELLGVATATVIGDGLATSDDTVVAPEAHGKGLGRALIGALFERLAALGVREVRGESSERRLRELPFFLRCGFEVVGEARAGRAEPWFVPGDRILRTRAWTSAAQRGNAAAFARLEEPEVRLR